MDTNNTIAEQQNDGGNRVFAVPARTIEFDPVDRCHVLAQTYGGGWEYIGIKTPSMVRTRKRDGATVATVSVRGTLVQAELHPCIAEQPDGSQVPFRAALVIRSESKVFHCPFPLATKTHALEWFRRGWNGHMSPRDLARVMGWRGGASVELAGQVQNRMIHLLTRPEGTEPRPVSPEVVFPPE